MRISDWSSDVCSSDLDTPTVEEAPPEAPVEPEVAVEPEVIEEPPVVEAPPAVKPRFRDRLGKARSTLSGYLGGIRASGKVDAETWDDLEEALIRADVGVTATTDILDRLRATVTDQKITDPGILLEALKAQLKADLASGDRTLAFERSEEHTSD